MDWILTMRVRRAERAMRALSSRGILRNHAVRIALDVLGGEERTSWATRMKMLTDKEVMDQKLFADLQERYVKMIADYNQAVGAAEILRRELRELKAAKQ